jgi:nitrate reductase NapE
LEIDHFVGLILRSALIDHNRGSASCIVVGNTIRDPLGTDQEAGLLFSTGSAVAVNGPKGQWAQIDNVKPCAKNRPTFRGRHERYCRKARKKTSTKKQELRSFLFLSVVTAPVLAVIIVAGWGFLVWMYQILAGPAGQLNLRGASAASTTSQRKLHAGKPQ